MPVLRGRAPSLHRWLPAGWGPGARRARVETDVVERLLDASPVGIGYLDRDLRFRRVNAVLARMNGIPEPAHLGRTPMELLPGIAPETYEPGLRSVLETGRSISGLEVHGLTPAQPGAVRWWEESFYPVPGDGGRVAGVGILAIEVTDRRVAQDALREQQATQRLIFDSAPSGMLLVDADGRIRAANPEAQRLFGYTAEELIGQPVETLVPHDVRAVHPGYRSAFLTDPRTRAMGHGRDLSALRKDGSLFPVEVGLAASASVRGLITCVVTDISARKRVEAERAALLDAERAARDRLARLQGVTEAGLRRLSSPDLMSELLDRVVHALGADVATVLMVGEGTRSLHPTATSRGTPDSGAVPAVPVDAGVVERCARHGTPVVVPVREHAPGTDDREILRSVVAAPLVVDGTLIGVLHAGSAEAGRFTGADVDLLTAVADRVALAVDRARTFERERDAARTLQRSLLPDSLPEPPGATLAARYLPGAVGAQVGGDWYDVLTLPDGALLLVVGDVMGRGLRAAAVMGELRNAVRIYARLGLSLPDIAERLNQTVLAKGETEMATVLLAQLTPPGGEVSWVAAGHPPAVCRAPDSTTSLLEGDVGVALGVVVEPAYVLSRTTLPPGSTLLLYTDGLIERATSSLDEGLRALLDAVRRAPAEADACCDRVVARFLSDGDSHDDVAVLAVQLHPARVRAFDLRVGGTAQEAAQARAQLGDWLASAGAGPTEVHDLLLAVGEALTTHAGGGPPAPACRIRADVDRARVDVVISGVAPAGPPNGTERGRGLVLMHGVLDELATSRHREGQDIRLTRRLGAGTAAPSATTTAVGSPQHLRG